MRLGDAKHLQIATLSTGIPSLDAVLGSGLPKGRIIEIFGPESAGKTTLALHAIAQAQQSGGTAAFLDGEVGDYLAGLHSSLMSKALRRLTSRLNAKQSDCILIFTNQLRYQIGVVSGSPETTTGGRALRFYASMRLEVRRIQTLQRGLDSYGIKIKIKAAKNKVAPPFRLIELDLQFGKGFQQGEGVLVKGLCEGA